MRSALFKLRQSKKAEPPQFTGASAFLTSSLKISARKGFYIQYYICFPLNFQVFIEHYSLKRLLYSVFREIPAVYPPLKSILRFRKFFIDKIKFIISKDRIPIFNAEYSLAYFYFVFSDVLIIFTSSGQAGRRKNPLCPIYPSVPVTTAVVIPGADVTSPVAGF